MGDVGLGRSYRELTSTVEEDSTIVFTRQCRINLVNHINALETHCLCQSERNQEVHSLSRLRDTQEGRISCVLEPQVVLRDLTRLDASDVVEATELLHQVLSVDGRIVAGATSRHNQVVNLLETFGFLLQTTKTYHCLVRHESRAVVQSLLHARRLFQHLHRVVVIDAGRELDADFFLGDGLEDVGLDAVGKRQLDDLLILNVVVSFRVVLEHGRV